LRGRGFLIAVNPTYLPVDESPPEKIMFSAIHSHVLKNVFSA
jgi:hypothetical protein